MRWMRSVVVAGVIALLLAGGVAAEPVRLLFIDTQAGAPYDDARQATVNELRRLLSAGGRRLEVQHYSLQHYDGIATRIWHSLGEAERHHDAVVVNGTMAAQAFRALAKDQPQQRFFFLAVTDPVGLGLIDSFDHPPSANFTGVSYPVPVRERLRLLRAVMPKARTIGLIYADMPQSHSYRHWLEAALAEPEFRDLKVIYRQIPFVPSDGGQQRMARLAAAEAQQLDGLVDLFLAPNDQLGVQPYFAQALATVISKPLMGVGERDVREGWGAAFTIYADQAEAGRQLAEMLFRYVSGTPFAEIRPQPPRKFGVLYDPVLSQRFGLKQLQLPLVPVKDAAATAVDE
ncbi:MAG: hypothetical protein II007_01355 [Gammaproteobacteria bacterium]|nr:hypothetical protein [Gammaproteobacteria bacterium]